MRALWGPCSQTCAPLYIKNTLEEGREGGRKGGERYAGRQGGRQETGRQEGGRGEGREGGGREEGREAEREIGKQGGRKRQSSGRAHTE